MTQAHIDAVMAALNAVSGLTAYDTEVTTTPSFPYVVVVAPSLARIAETLTDAADDIADYIRVTAAGTGPEQARWAQEQAYAALDRTSPTVSGYIADIRRTATGVLAVDPDVKLPGTGHVIFATDTYRYRATPA